MAYLFDNGRGQQQRVGGTRPLGGVLHAGWGGGLRMPQRIVGGQGGGLSPNELRMALGSRGDYTPLSGLGEGLVDMVPAGEFEERVARLKSTGGKVVSPSGQTYGEMRCGGSLSHDNQERARRLHLRFVNARETLRRANKELMDILSGFDDELVRFADPGQLRSVVQDATRGLQILSDGLLKINQLEDQVPMEEKNEYGRWIGFGCIWLDYPANAGFRQKVGDLADQAETYARDAVSQSRVNMIKSSVITLRRSAEGARQRALAEQQKKKEAESAYASHMTRALNALTARNTEEAMRFANMARSVKDTPEVRQLIVQITSVAEQNRQQKEDAQRAAEQQAKAQQQAAQQRDVELARIEAERQARMAELEFKQQMEQRRQELELRRLEAELAREQQAYEREQAALLQQQSAQQQTSAGTAQSSRLEELLMTLIASMSDQSSRAPAGQLPAAAPMPTHPGAEWGIPAPQGRGYAMTPWSGGPAGPMRTYQQAPVYQAPAPTSGVDPLALQPQPQTTSSPAEFAFLQTDTGWAPPSGGMEMFGLVGVRNHTLPNDSQVENGYKVHGPESASNGFRYYTVERPNGSKFRMSYEQAHKADVRVTDPDTGDVFYVGGSGSDVSSSDVADAIRDITSALTPAVQMATDVYVRTRDGELVQNAAGRPLVLERQASGKSWLVGASVVAAALGGAYLLTRKKR